MHQCTCPQQRTLQLTLLLFNSIYLTMLPLLAGPTILAGNQKIGRLLAWFFCSLFINSPLGINSQWISTDDNKIADNISQIKKTLPNILHSFDYSSLCQTYPELTHCSFFQIQPELTLLMWDIVLTNNWPTHEEVQILKRKPLHNLITSNGQE